MSAGHRPAPAALRRASRTAWPLSKIIAWAVGCAVLIFGGFALLMWLVVR